MARPAGQGEKTKKRIAEKAKLLFEQKGYAASSMGEICKVTGVSRGSIYFHFESKEAVFLYTVEEANKAWRDKWDDISTSVDSATEKLYLLGRHCASDMQSKLSQTVPEYFYSENVGDELSEKIEHLVKPEFEIYQQLINDGVHNGEFKSEVPADELAAILYGMLTGISGVQYLLGYDDKEHFLKTYDYAICVFLNGVADS